MKNIRIGNIEYRTSSGINGDTYEEVVFWYRNKQYGSEDRLKKEGWVFDEEGNASKDNCTIHHGLFKTEYLCYTVAFIEWNRSHDEYDVRSVGLRAFELEDENDRDDFLKVIKLIGEVNNR